MADPLQLEAEAWLARANDDLGAARKLLSGQDPFTASASYHCQQAAEKALKAVLASSGEAIPKTHDLRVLIGRCVAIETSLEALRDACDELTPYATEFRYPTSSPDPTFVEVDAAIAFASAIVQAVALALSKRFSRPQQ